MIVQIINELETIKKLQEGYSIARFGDGEFRLINGKDICFQKNDEKLSNKLLEIVKQENISDKLLVAIPPFFASYIYSVPNHMDNEKVITYWRKYMKNKDSINIWKLLENKIYYSSFISRLESFDLDYREIIKEEIKKIWIDKKIILVVNHDKYKSIKNKINEYIGYQKIEIIIFCPDQNAYDKYGDIYSECTKYSREYIHLLMLGPTASVLASELTKLGYQSIDIGSFFEHI